MQQIICMKWGDRYSSDYVNRLYFSIKKFTKRKTDLICFTDNPNEINENVLCKPIPKISMPYHMQNSPWKKLAIWQFPLSPLRGDVLFLDLDLVITGDLDRFFDYEKDKFCVIENWTQLGSGIGNTSCFRFPVGKYKNIYDKFQSAPQYYFKKYRIEQVFISKNISTQVFWPKIWCQSFKHNLLPSWPKRIWQKASLPKETSIVAFTGKPDPDEVLNGIWPVPKNQFYKKIYKQLRTPDWLKDNWNI